MIFRFSMRGGRLAALTNPDFGLPVCRQLLFGDSRNTPSPSHAILLKTECHGVMVFGTSQHLAKASRPALKMLESFLLVKDFSKYLGVIFYSNLDWHGHIDTIASKVSHRLGLLRRIRKYVSIDVYKQLYNSIVQPF